MTLRFAFSLYERINDIPSGERFALDFEYKYSQTHADHYTESAREDLKNFYNWTPPSDASGIWVECALKADRQDLLHALLDPARDPPLRPSARCIGIYLAECVHSPAFRADAHLMLHDATSTYGSQFNEGWFNALVGIKYIGRRSKKQPSGLCIPTSVVPSLRKVCP